VRALSLLVLVYLSACVSVPTHSSPCANLSPDCELKTAGLKASKTVQRAVLAPTLINGVPAEPNDWPASVYAKMGDAACSATVVGDRVLFMASHCMVDQGIVTFTAHANSYSARCSHHPEYAKNPTADWALCLIDRPVIGIPFEVLGIEEKLSIGDTILMSGYGCIHPGGGGGNDGIFRVGNAVIEGMPKNKTYDVVTRGGAAVCFGDSGGSAYHVHSNGARYVFGVNSRGDISTMSYLPGVFAPTFVAWAKVWARGSNNVKICGVHPDALGCRINDLTDGKFELDSAAACVKGVIKSDYLGKKDAIVEKLRKAIN
jgi:hypothetical protein